MDNPAQIVIRKPCPNDKDFILSAWLKGNYYGNSYFRQIPPDIYYREYADEIMRILNQPGVEIDIACDESYTQWIVGFSVTQNENLYWIHVKRDFRCRGVGKLLLANRIISTVKSTTKVGHAIAQNKGLIFNPF